jgi:hypothetical protein
VGSRRGRTSTEPSHRRWSPRRLAGDTFDRGGQRQVASAAVESALTAIADATSNRGVQSPHPPLVIGGSSRL